jgi:hypothetical protein
LYTLIFNPIWTTYPTHHILIDLFILIILGDSNKSRNLSLT